MIYKGCYGLNLKGPEVRYISLAKSLHSLGYTITIAACSFNKEIHPKYINFLHIHNFFKMAVAFIKSDCIILHGGGFVLLSLSVFSGFIGKKIIFDNYSPRWVELDEVIFKSNFNFGLFARSSFNSFRSLLAVLVFNFVIVANKRQMDLFRGFLVPFSQTKEFSRIKQIPFGCEIYEDRSRKSAIKMLNKLSPGNAKLEESDFLIGWLGGVYDWFDLNSVMESVSEAFMHNSKIKIVFFGVSDAWREKMLSQIPEDNRYNFFFLPWIDFNKRFDYWAAFDVSLVWGGKGFENDYASRTRNFDCLSIGLPIIQNYDDEWGERLIANNCGVVTDIESLSSELLSLSKNPEKINNMHMAMINLAPDFYWLNFANEFKQAVDSSKISFIRRTVGLLVFLSMLPAAALFFIYNLFNGLIKSR